MKHTIPARRHLPVAVGPLNVVVLIAVPNPAADDVARALRVAPWQRHVRWAGIAVASYISPTWVRKPVATVE